MRPFRGSAPEARAIVTGRGSPPGGPRVEVAGISLSHPDRVFWPDEGITKLELARYYEAVGEWMLPHVAGRPLTLVRCPRDIRECAYMRHVRAWGPSALRRVRIPEREKLGEYLVVDDVAGLVALAQMDILEIHTWNADAGRVERPNRVVIDLDPDEDVSFHEVAAAALRVRDRLRALELESFVKSTGGKGLHVVVPLAGESWPASLAFARALCGAIAREDPRRFTIQMSRARRRGRIYLDYLRNNRGNSSVAAFSTRAKPGAPVSLPLGWPELGRPPDFRMRDLPKLLARRRDPWAGYFRLAQRLHSAMTRALELHLADREVH